MEPSSLLTSMLDYLHHACEARSPISNSTKSSSPSVLFTHEQPPLTTLLTKAKRDDAQCRIPVTTWLGPMYVSSSTITVELPCASTPWNTAGSPITENSPQQPITPTIAGPIVTAMTQQPATTTQQSSSPSSTNPSSILHMDEGGVAAIISVLSITVLGAAISCYFWRRKMGMIRGRKENHAPVQGPQWAGNGGG